MPSRKKNKNTKTKKASTASAPAAAPTLAPDTTLGSSPANIPSVKTAIDSVVASHHLNVFSIIKNNVAMTSSTTSTTSTSNPPAPPEKSTARPISAKAAAPAPAEESAVVPEVAPALAPAPPTTLPKSKPEPAAPVSQEQPLQPQPQQPSITTPVPAAVVDSHHASLGTEAQKPMPVPQSEDSSTRRQAKKTKLKKKCLIL